MSDREFIPSDLVVLRTPLLPMEEIEAWSAGLLSPGNPGDAEAFQHDRALLRSRLQALLERPEVRDALFLASPDLTESLAQWQRDPDGKKGQRTENGLVRYFLRMASRPTPFGLFSGCTPGTVGERTRIALAERREYRRHSRLDMDYLFALCEHLGTNPELRSEILYRPNSSLSLTAGRFRYSEARVNSRLRTYHLVAVNESEALKSTLERAADGARLEDLAQALVDGDPDGEITLEDATAFLHQLVDNQFLLPDLALPVTGEESTPGLLDQLRQLEDLPPAAEARERVEGAERELAAIDAGGLGSDPERYREIARGLEPLGVAVGLSRLFQVDMIKPAREVALGPEVIGEILRGVELLHGLTPMRGEGALDNFRSAFKDRYGEGREVPLLDALDEESGIGFDRSGAIAAEGSPLFEGLPFQPRNERLMAQVSNKDAFLLRLLARALSEGRMEMALGKEDLERLASSQRPLLPDAFHTMVTLVAGSPEALEGGDWRLVLEHAAGPSGAKIFGRFCHADEQIRAGVAAHLAAEESHLPEALFAEVVHLPAGRIGNILARPVLRSHEIPFLGRSGAPRERQIPVQDLTVTVTGDRIRLRSQRLGREIVPCLTTAHNTARESLGVYRFLAALRGQGVAPGIRWDWGLLDAAPFLPRVSSGRLVLSRARWLVLASEIKKVAAATGAERYRLAQEWREELRMPRFVALVDGDNELLVDFHNPLSLDAAIELVKSRDQMVFTEQYPAPDELCASGPEGRFFHELVVPFVRRPAERPRPAAVPGIAAAAASSGFARSFPPGSEWLYAKMYTGKATADEILQYELGPLAREAVEAGEARSWFFIRYGDPEWHLRIRFHGDPRGLREGVLPRLDDCFRRLLDFGATWKLQLDTYEREVERYGGNEGIELSEQLFHHDSEAVVDMLDSLADEAGADLRWRVILAGMDRMMEDFGLDLEGRLRAAERGRAAFANRYKHEAMREPMADRLRKERRSLERLLVEREQGPEEARPALAALRRRSEALAPIARELRNRKLQGSFDDMLISYVHMFVNRLSRSAGPEHELVLYDFLTQIYSSLLARARKGDSRRAAAG